MPLTATDLLTARRPSLFEQQVERLAADLQASAAVEDPEALARWKADPIAWAVERLRIPRETLEWSLLPEYGEHAWDGTKDPLAAILKGLTTHRRIGVESGTGTGKTFLLMVIVFWWLAVWKGLVVTIAPKKDQLSLHVWKEIASRWSTFHRMFPDARLRTGGLRILMKPGDDAGDEDVQDLKWAAVGFVAGVGANEESASKAQGFHQEDMLFLIEEGPGVHGAIYNAVVNTSIGKHNLILAVGNPDYQQDPLHRFILTTPGCLHVRISALDHPNLVCAPAVVVPGGAVSPESVEEKLLKFGEQSPMYQSRVRGLSPSEATDALIKLSWCYAARDRGLELLAKFWPNKKATLEHVLLWPPEALAKLALALGVDVANSVAGDKAAVARGRGPICCSVDSFQCPDANVLGTQLAAEMRERKILQGRVGVDGVGVGVGTVNELRRNRFAVQALLGGIPARDLPQMFKVEKFKNLRSQMYWLARIDLQNGVIILPNDEELFEDLVALTWQDKDKAIEVETKDSVKEKLGGRSTDKGDAFVYWNWVRQVPPLGTWKVSKVPQ